MNIGELNDYRDKYEQVQVPQVLLGYGDQHTLIRHDGEVFKWSNDEWRDTGYRTDPLPDVPGTLFHFDLREMLKDMGRQDIIDHMDKDRRISMEIVDKMEGDNMEKNLFDVGQVIDIRVGGGSGLPNRLQIIGMEYDITGGDGWNYKCLMEDSGEVYEYNEKFISKVRLAMDSQVYLKPVIMERYKNGWRFVGNWSFNHCKKFGESLAKDERIAHVRVCEAYDASGNIKTDVTSLWIQYHRPIAGGVTNQKTVKLDIK